MPLHHAPIDRLAIALSGVCAVHCVLVVAAITTIPLWGLSWLTNPHFHEWFLAIALLPSVLALGNGFRKHALLRVLAGGAVALGLMATAIMLRTSGLISEDSEVALTLSGALLLAATHWYNLRHSRCHHEQGSCSSD